MATPFPTYRSDLALVHDRGFGFYADRCAEAILAWLEPLRGGRVLELGCGSGALTRRLVEAGHRVVATDASPAMLALAAQKVPGAEEIRSLVLPDDQLPRAEAIVSVGHVLNYLPDLDAIDRALTGVAKALQPGGLLLLDVLDLAFGKARQGTPSLGNVGEDWAEVTRFSQPRPDLFVRDITTFVQSPDGTWRRDDERHENVLVDADRQKRSASLPPCQRSAGSCSS